jgi:hypothetical protein
VHGVAVAVNMKGTRRPMQLESLDR